MAKPVYCQMAAPIRQKVASRGSAIQGWDKLPNPMLLRMLLITPASGSYIHAHTVPVTTKESARG